VGVRGAADLHAPGEGDLTPAAGAQAEPSVCAQHAAAQVSRGTGGDQVAR